MSDEWVLHAPADDGPFRAVALTMARRFAPPIRVMRGPDVDREAMDRALESLRGSHFVLPPSFSFEIIGAGTPRSFTARTALGSGVVPLRMVA